MEKIALILLNGGLRIRLHRGSVADQTGLDRDTEPRNDHNRNHHRDVVAIVMFSVQTELSHEELRWSGRVIYLLQNWLVDCRFALICSLLWIALTI